VPAAPSRPLSPRLAALVARYRAVAVLVLNLLLLVLALNVVLGLVYAVRDALSDHTLGPARKYPEAALAAAYPGMSRDDRNALLRETWSRPFRFADYTMFRERPFAGKYVNVSPHGFRLVKDQGPWPPDPTNINVFVFGGSTAFGYGVPDDQSVASHLQDVLGARSKGRVCVYNFAAGFYYSTQERILFEKLLNAGHVPQLAIFIDGLNDGESPDDQSAHHAMLEEVFDHPERVLFLGPGADRVPMVRLVRSLADNVSRARQRAKAPDPEAENRRLLEAVPRYLRNQRLIEATCREFSVTPLFVWQPVPGYEYDPQYHPFGNAARSAKQAFFYEAMRRATEGPALPKCFLWCADIQRSAQENLYVDGVHYTARFSRRLAEVIVQRAQERGLLGAAFSP